MSKITVIFPLYRAAPAVPELVASLARQRHPDGLPQSDWLEAIFIDNASPDNTVEVLRQTLNGATTLDADIRVIENSENVGLARSFNRALGLTTTDFVLTCHADCQFGSDTYVAEMLGLLSQTPDAAAITGQPTASTDASRVEKVYLTANLMDLFPPDTETGLTSIGFAEGRCDGFRMEALRAVGFYDTSLRRAGEDQVMAARLRNAGYSLYQAPHLHYVLSVSSDQDSLTKLIHHARLFGRVYPYVLSQKGTVSGVASVGAGSNRHRRAALRALQLASGGATIGALIARRRRTRWLLGLGSLGVARAALFRPYVRHLRMEPGDITALTLLQPPLDAAFYLGLAEGFVALGKSRSSGDPI
jgi:GT2 family glycosyltransferase